MSSENSTTTVESVESNSKHDVAVWRCVGHTQKDDAQMIYAGRESGSSGLKHFKNSEIGERGWLGNPYKESTYGRRQCVEMFAEEFDERLKNDPEFAGAIAGLAGKRLGCWCQQLHEEDGDLCHAEVIADRAQKLAQMADSDEGDEDDDDDDDDDASDGGSDEEYYERNMVHADGRNTELADVLPSLDERDAWRLAQMGIDTVADVVSLTQDELANKPLFEGDAELVMQEATTVEEKRRVLSDSDDDAASTTDVDDTSESDRPTRQVTNEVDQRCTPATSVAVVAPSGTLEGDTMREVRDTVLNAIARSPFDPSGIVAVSDFCGTDVDAAIHLHNTSALDDGDKLRQDVVSTDWDEIEGKPDDEIGEKTDEDGQVVHRWWKNAPQQRDETVLDCADAIIALDTGGYLDDLLDRAPDEGVDVWDDRRREHRESTEKVTIQAFDDTQLREGHQGALDEDDARENPRSEVENTW